MSSSDTQDIRGLIGTKNAIFPDIAHVLMLGERHFDFQRQRRYDLDVYKNAVLGCQRQYIRTNFTRRDGLRPVICARLV